MGQQNISAVCRVSQVEIGHSSKTSLIQETEGENPPREWDFRPLCGSVNILCFQSFQGRHPLDPQQDSALDPLGACSAPDPSSIEQQIPYTNEDRRSENSFRNTSQYKMKGFIVVTCSFLGEFKLNLHIICCRFITNITNFVTGLADTKKCPEDLTFTKNFQIKLSHVAKKLVNSAKKPQYKQTCQVALTVHHQNLQVNCKFN